MKAANLPSLKFRLAPYIFVLCLLFQNILWDYRTIYSKSGSIPCRREEKMIEKWKGIRSFQNFWLIICVNELNFIWSKLDTLLSNHRTSCLKPFVITISENTLILYSMIALQYMFAKSKTGFIIFFFGWV